MGSAFLQLKEFLFVNLNAILFNLFNQMSSQGSLQMQTATTELTSGSRKTIFLSLW